MALPAISIAAEPLKPDPAMGDGGVPAFYVWTARLPDRPGVLLRHETLPAAGLPPRASGGVRILYSARSGVGAGGITAVSGMVLLPKGGAPAAGWPIVAWEHGTTGIADVCAPSWLGRGKRDETYLDAWLKHGFAIVATDYEGLGTPGPHPYLLWHSEAYSVFDGLRAALSDRQLRLANDVVLVGQSQGAGAALAAAWAAPHDARALHIRAAVLTGLVTGIASERTRQKAAQYSDPSQMNAAFAMLRFAGSDHALHPGADLATYLTPKGRMLLATALHGCLHDLFAKSRALGANTGADLFARSIAPVDRDMERAFTLPDGRVSMPVFVGTGLADGEAGTGGQYDAVAAMCAAGTTLAWHTYPGLTHNGTVNASLADSLAFVSAVRSGHKPAGTCASLAPPGPLQTAKAGVPFND